MSDRDQRAVRREHFPAVPRGGGSGFGQEPEREQSNDHDQQDVPVDHEPLPTLQESFDIFDEWTNDWNDESTAARQAFNLQPLSPQRAAAIRHEKNGGDAGENEGLVAFADVDYLTMLQVSHGFRLKQKKRPREENPADESDGDDHTPPRSGRRGSKQPRLGDGPDETRSPASTPTARIQTPNTSLGQGRSVATGQSQQGLLDSGRQQSSYLSPDLHPHGPPALPPPARPTRQSGGTLHSASGRFSPYYQQQTPDTRQRHHFASSIAPQSQNLAARLPPQQAPIPAIPFVNGQYQMTAWGRLDQDAAAGVKAPLAGYPPGGYGADRLPPPPNPRTPRPAPYTQKVYAIAGYLIQARSGRDRTELYRALYASVLALLRFRKQLGEQQPQFWVKLKDYRYKEARARLKSDFVAVQPGATDKQFNAAIPDRENVAEGWDDYLEDWDLPYRAFSGNEERARWLEYYWSSTERRREKDTIAPLAFDDTFLRSEKVGKFWRQDVRQWELGTKVLVTLEEERVIILDMD